MPTPPRHQQHTGDGHGLPGWGGELPTLTRDRGSQAKSLWSWAVTGSFHREWTEGEKSKKHPSDTHFPAPDTWSFLPSHRTTAPSSSRHSWALSGQGNPERQPTACGSHRCPSPQKRGGSQPSWKGLQRPSSATPPFPQGEGRATEGAQVI